MIKLSMLSLSLVFQTNAMDANNQLYVAWHSRNYDNAAQALQRGANPDYKCVLSEASFFGPLEMVQLLLEAGADVEYSGNDSWTPLIHAIRGGNLSIVKSLVAAGARVGPAAVMHAAAKFNEEIEKIIRDIQLFVHSALGTLEEKPGNERHYLLLSVSYKKDKAFRFLIMEKPEFFADIKLVARCFLRAARVGNFYAFNYLKKIVENQKREGFKAVYAKAAFYITLLHPEHHAIAHQLWSEKIVPAS